MEDKALSDTVNPHCDINQRITRSKSLVSDTRKSKSEERGHSHMLSMVLEQRDHLHSELIGKIRVIEYLKDREEDVNIIATELVGWEELFRKFQVCAKDYIDKLDSQDKKDDAVEWYQTESNGFHKFHSRLSTWVKDSTTSPEDSQDVRPKDSISQVESKTSSVRSAKVNALAKRAELIANQKKLKEMHLIEEEETKLKQRIEEEETKIRQRKERLDLETEIEIANAQFEIYDQFDTQSNVIDTNQKLNPSLNPQAVEFRPIRTQNSQPQLEETLPNLIPQQSTQQKDLVHFIVENQKLSSLPVRKIPTFSGKPVDYKPFIRSFEHGIEEKTSDPRDRLYYLDQYTSGEPNDLVRSCIHMDPEEGYQTARSLLDKKFGNKYKLATAHIAKALNWPSIKTEDAEALTSFSIFLTSCGNTMKDIEYMRELDHPKNLRDIAFKLPYKLRERWRSVSLPIIERRPITFLDFAEFVDRQAQILTNPIFGDICDDRQHKVDPREPKKLRSFATETKKEERKSDNLSKPNKAETEEKRYHQSKAFAIPCWFCDNHHSLDRCRNFQGRSLQEKIDFLRPKGLCFGCLQVGHTSRECLNRLVCQICDRTHATCFHDNSRDHPREYSPKKVSTNSVAASINSTTTGQVSCMPVVPIRIKSRSSNMYVETYAFLDNGSSATFCTDKLAKELRVSGKKTEIIVNTLNQRKQVDTSLIEELEISDIQGSQWIRLPTVFTQVKMPISKATIPKDEFFKQWPHLEDISLAPIDAEIGLLIGNNVPQAMEPQEVIKSENEGPYAVRTLLGWTINGLMQECGPGEEDCLNYVSVNRTDVLANHALDKHLKVDFIKEFSDKSSKDKADMSHNDKQLLEMTTSTKKLKDGHCQMSLPFKDPFIKFPKEDAEAEKVAYANLTNHQFPCTGLEELINHYSDWFALKKAIAWLLKIKAVLLERIKKRKEIPVISEKNSTFLTIRNLKESEEAIIKYIQRQSFPKEMEILISGNSAKVGKSSPLCKLDPFIEGGLMRVGGRLNKASMPESSKHPVILPKDSHVSRLIIRHIHIQCGHSGRNFVLSSLFQKYWMIKANAAVRKEIHSCVRCRREHAPVQNQKMADLPTERVTPDKPPFTYVGVDYFGPFDVKQRRSHVKRYGVLFTCLTTRAVHIEIAQSLDTDSCINALRRFISRRGQVTKMWSDNGTNFVGSERELKEQIDRWNKNQIHQELLQRNIEWTFNPPTGSHHGGVWERQIRTVRKILRSVVKEQTVDEETLQTVLCEIESIINNRPITRASDDPGDLEALTPNHLLLMKKMPALPPGMVDDNYPRRRWRQVQYMADLFWKRWTREYLPLLQERQKWVKLRRNLQRGDVVLIVDNLAPRSSWAMGRVSELNTDSKGVVRTVRVRTQSSELIRPISKLCLLLESDC